MLSLSKSISLIQQKVIIMTDIRRNNVSDIRKVFASKLASGDFTTTGSLEITAANFIADEDSIFGKPNEAYIEKELRWYLNQDLSITGLAPNIPKIWKDVACNDGFINSNYGWCILSGVNGYQYVRAIETLMKDKASRQAMMIYTRPSMHEDAFSNGRKDFMCTNTVQLLIRDNKLEYHVSMRSNDVVFGYNNDVAWHRYVHNRALSDLAGVELGDMYWSAGSLHVYPRHFDMVTL